MEEILGKFPEKVQEDLPEKILKFSKVLLDELFKEDPKRNLCEISEGIEKKKSAKLLKKSRETPMKISNRTLGKIIAGTPGTIL